MGALEFGQLVDDALKESGLSQRRLASRLGELPDGSVFDSTQIRMLRLGRRVLTHELVSRLINLLDLDPAEAWSRAGLWPPELSADGFRLLRQLEHLDDDAAIGAVKRHRSARHGIRPVQAIETATTQGERTSPRTCVPAGQRPRILRVFPALRLRAA